MNQLFTLKQRIMWRVYVLWALRVFMQPTTLKVLALTAFVWRSTTYVSYAQVFHNAPSLTADLAKLGSNVSFAQSALTHTETATLLLLGGVATIMLWMVYDILPFHRRAASHAHMRHA